MATEGEGKKLALNIVSSKVNHKGFEAGSIDLSQVSAASVGNGGEFGIGCWRQVAVCGVTCDQRLFPRRPLQLPNAQRDHRRDGDQDERRCDNRHALHGRIRPSRAALRYSDCSNAALPTRKPPTTSPSVTAGQIRRWTQKGGATPSCRVMAPAITMAPTISVRNAAGPSPTLNCVKSSPHERHFAAKATTPSKSVAAPHCGHVPLSAAAIT